MKQIILNKNIFSVLSDNHFFNAGDGQASKITTTVRLKYDNDFLHIHFYCNENTFVASNTYFENNSEMWNQEVFELFIAKGNEIPEKYLELEINPNNAIFVAWVQNPTGLAPENLTFVNPETSGIKYEVNKGIDYWNGILTVPFTLLGEKSNEYRLNFHRIVLKNKQENKDWKCNNENANFECWSATMCGNEPAFHRPAAFGKLVLQ